MMTFACVLNPSKDFDARYVHNLARGLAKYAPQPHQLICLTNEQIRGVACVPVDSKLPGWWAKMALLDIQGPMIYLDLDTIILGDLAPLVEFVEQANNPCMLQMLGAKKERFECGILGWSEKAWRWWIKQLGPAFARECMRFVPGGSRDQQAMEDYRGNRWNNDEDWLRAKIVQEKITVERLQDWVSGIYSYRMHALKAPPPDARIVCFHGEPRPRDVVETERDSWVAGEWS